MPFLPDTFSLRWFRGGFFVVNPSAAFPVNRKESHRDTGAKTGSPDKCTQRAETFRFCSAENSNDDHVRGIGITGRGLVDMLKFVTFHLY